MKTINRVFLAGRLGGKPESRTTKKGKPYARFSVATERKFKVDEGNFDRVTDWHNVMVYGPAAKLCLDKLDKGSQIFIEGEISSYRYEENGQFRRATSITAQNVTFPSLPLLSAPAS